MTECAQQFLCVTFIISNSNRRYMGEERGRGSAFCQQCATETPIKRTVPWQLDICTVCGSDIPAGDK